MKIARWAVPLGFLAVLFYFPLAVIFARGFSADSIAYVFSSSAIELIWFTVWQALISAAGSVVFGLIFAYLLYRKYFWGQMILRALLTVPFVLPILVIAMAFSTFQISNVIVAIILSHIYINTSIVARAVGSHWLSLDAHIEDAAALDGAGRLTIFFRVTIWELRPAVVSSFVLAFAYCAAGFGTVLLLGNGQVNSIETAIYNKVFSYLDLSAATGLAAVQLILTLLLFVISNRLVKGEFGLGSTMGISNQRLDWRDLPITVGGVLLVLVWVLPIWNVFQIAFSVNAEFGIDGAMVTAGWHSLRNVSIVVLLCATFGVFVSYELARARAVVKRLLGFAYLAPIGISTVLVGLGYLIGFGPFRSSWLVIPLAETVLALPLVVRLVSTALESVDREQLEQAQVDGANRWQVFRFVELASIQPSLAAALGFAGIIALGDFGASSFLSFGDQETLPILLYRYFSRPGSENYQQAMFLAALFVVATVFVVLATSIRNLKRTALATY